MKILAMDCAHGSCSAAVWNGTEITAFQKSDMERGQAEALMPMVLGVMKESGLDFHDLDCVAVTTGPGSFTGVRVGLAAADGIALAADLPMIGVAVTDALAYEVFRKHPEIKSFCTVLETKRDDYYACFYTDGKSESEPFVATAADLNVQKDVVFTGNGTDRLKTETTGLSFVDMAMPTAATVAELASTRSPTSAFPAPLYLREAEVCLCRK